MKTQDITFATLAAMTTVAELNATIDFLETSAGVIEAQLEFPNDEADPDWERRAIGALGIVRAKIASASRHLGRIEKRADKDDVFARRELMALESLAASERKATEALRLAAAEATRQAQFKHALLKAWKQLNVDNCFAEAARELLDKDTFYRICGVANARRDQRAIALFEPAPEPTT